MRIGLLADLQCEEVGPHEREAVERLMAERPDLILLSGTTTREPRRRSSTSCPSCAGCSVASGRPEASSRFRAILRSVDELRRIAAGTGVLADEIARVRVGDRRVAIAGLNRDYWEPAAGRVARRLESAPGGGEVRLLLAHRPDAVRLLSRHTRVDLTLAGHTHGGQVQLPYRAACDRIAGAAAGGRGRAARAGRAPRLRQPRGGGGARTGAAPAPGSGAGGVADHAALENARVAVIALIDGEHHPSAVRELLARVEAERGLAGVVFCGGEEKLPAGPLAEVYGRPLEDDLEAALGRLAGAADAVLDLADEPVLPPHDKLRLAAHALHHWPTRPSGCGSPRRATSRSTPRSRASR